MPNPSPTETEDDFISRCMSDEEMKQKHPERDERFAVCQNFWDNQVKGEDSNESA